MANFFAQDNTQSNNSSSDGNYLDQAAYNFFPSLGNAIGGVFGAVTHPWQTFKNIGGVALGETEKGLSSVFGQGNVNPNNAVGRFNAGVQNQATQFNQNFLGGALAGKGLQGFEDKFKNDPAGALLDISMFGEGVGASLDAANTILDSSKIASFSNKISSISSKINPVSASFKVIGGVSKYLGTPSAETASKVQDLQDVGINPKTAAIQATTGSPLLSTAANFIKTGLFGKGIQNSVDTTLNELNTKANELTNSFPKSLDNPTLGKNIISQVATVSKGLDTTANGIIKSFEPAADNATLGQKIINDKTAFEKTSGATSSKLYTDIENKYGNAPAQISNTVKAIEGQIEYLKRSAVPDTNGALKILQTTLDNLQSGRDNQSGFSTKDFNIGTRPEDIARYQAKVKSALEKQVNPGERPYTPTVDILKSTRTSIGALAQKDPHIYEPIRQALTQDRLATVNKISPTAGAEISKADTLYKSTLDKLGTNASNLIDKGTPEQIVQKFISGGNSTTLNALKQIISPQTYNQIGLSWIKDSLTKAVDPTTGTLNIKKFTDIVNSLDIPTKNALFEPKQIQELNQKIEQLKNIDSIKTNFSQNVTKFIDNSSPEQVVNKLINENNSTNLTSLKQVIDPETFRQIGLSWISDKINQATDPTTGILDPRKFNNLVNSLDEPTKNALFEPEQLKQLQQVSATITKVEKIQDTLTKNATPGKFMQNTMALRSLGLPFIIATGGSGTFAHYLIGMMGGEYVGSKLFTSKLGKSLLSTGNENLAKFGQRTQQVGAVAGKSGQVGNILNETNQK